MGNLKATVKPPDTYTGSISDWQALPGTKRYKIMHAVRIAEKRKTYASNNKDKLNTISKKWRTTHPEKCISISREYYKSNQADILAKKKVRYHANSDTIMEKQRARKLEKDKTFLKMFGEDGVIP